MFGVCQFFSGSCGARQTPCVSCAARRVARSISWRGRAIPRPFKQTIRGRCLKQCGGSAFSDFFVVESWVKSRLRDRGGRRSSALDDIRPEQWTAGMTQEPLELIWIVEATLTMQPELNMVLAHIIDGPLLVAADLPLPTAAERAIGCGRGPYNEYAAGHPPSFIQPGSPRPACAPIGLRRSPHDARCAHRAQSRARASLRARCGMTFSARHEATNSRVS
jgi:hypothetical protein